MRRPRTLVGDEGMDGMILMWPLRVQVRALPAESRGGLHGLHWHDNGLG